VDLLSVERAVGAAMEELRTWKHSRRVEFLGDELGACARPDGPARGHILYMGCAGSKE